MELYKNLRSQAMRRGLDVITDLQRVMIFEEGIDMEWLVSYKINPDESFTFEDQIYGKKIESLPEHIEFQSDLIEVFQLISDCLKTHIYYTEP